MFVYCLNNPGNYLDRKGEDAIWIQEESNVGSLGHSGLLVEDDDGQWYYFYWGDGANGSSRTYYLIKVDVEGYDLTNTEDVIEVVDHALAAQKDLSDEFRKKRHNITSTIYFDGDYGATYNYLDNLRDSDKEYHFLLNNCVQISWMAMAQSDRRFTMATCSVIPNRSYVEILHFKNFTVSEYERYRWIRAISGT